ncbi:cytochrome P450 [Abortiporus biennis]|nr:cytochrome P450 [Abortiporus biennis]
MISLPLTIVAALLLAAFVVHVKSRIDKRRRYANLPPGPSEKSYIVGPRAYMKFEELTDKYGSVFSYVYQGDVHVVITRYAAVVDIMQKHSQDLVDRAGTVGVEIMTGGMKVLTARAGERLKKLRRALHSHLQPVAVRQYSTLQRAHAKTYILNLLHQPDQIVDHAKTYAASVIMSVTYGKMTPTTYQDSTIREVVASLHRLFEVLHPGQFLVDVFPILRFFPFGGVAKLRKYHQLDIDLFRGQLDVVEEQLSKNEATPSFGTYLLEHQEDLQLSKNEAAYLAGSMFGAGSDTTATGISFVAMAAACYPQEVRKVQAQLDIVVGRDRLPTFEDMPFLPRVTAFFFEAHRWRPISIQGFTHRATKDIHWNGFTIPSGAIVRGNHWSILHDPEVFPDPETFNPDRWLDDKGHIREDIKHFGFGFGRRVCPGQHLADRSLFINTAMLLWAFDIAEDPSAPINTMNFTDTANVQVSPFKVKLDPRIEDLERIVDSDLN